MIYQKGSKNQKIWKDLEKSQGSGEDGQELHAVPGQPRQQGQGPPQHTEHSLFSHSDGIF